MQRDSSVVGIDTAKRVFHLGGMDARGKIVMRTRCSRGEVLPMLANLVPTTMVMEACGGAHSGTRRLRAQEQEGTLMAPQFVKPSVEANQNDLREAEAIAEAMTRPSIRFGPGKGPPELTV